MDNNPYIVYLYLVACQKCCTLHHFYRFYHLLMYLFQPFSLYVLSLFFLLKSLLFILCIGLRLSVTISSFFSLSSFYNFLLLCHSTIFPLLILIHSSLSETFSFFFISVFVRIRQGGRRLFIPFRLRDDILRRKDPKESVEKNGIFRGHV